MTLKDKSAARRFITLIDTFYDAKVRVICGADDYPERLFITQGDNSLKVRDSIFIHKMWMDGMMNSSSATFVSA